jgi:archaeosine-15-forming tRNA-guanine transglycosylase
MRSVRSLVATLSVVALGLVVGVDRSLACSCALGDPRSTLASTDAAFIGTLVARTEPEPGPIRSSADPVTLTFRVEEVVKGGLGGTVDVETASSGASCGLEVEIGGRTGLFLLRREGKWTSNLCLQIAPRDLRAAARPLPRPNGAGPKAFLVGGRFGPMGTVALDRRGRTLAYGRGTDQVVFLSLCPQARRVVEVTQGERVRVVVRDLATMRVVRRPRLPVWRRLLLRSACCRDAAGSDIVLFATDESRPVPEGRLVRLRSGRARTVWRGAAIDAVVRPARAFVSAGRRGTRAVAVALPGGRARALAELPAGTGALVPSPDGKRLAAVAYSEPRGSSAPPSRVVLVDLSGSRPRVRTAALRSANVIGTMAWSSPERVVFLPWGGEVDRVRVYDTKLRSRGGFAGWDARSPVLRGGYAYGLRWGGRVVRARLPNGPVQVVRSLPGPVANALVAVSEPSRSGVSATGSSAAAARIPAAALRLVAAAARATT